MSLPVPDNAALEGVAAGYGLGLDQAQLDEYAPLVAGLLGSWDAVEELYEAEAPVTPQRQWSQPSDAENPFHAWYVQTSITETDRRPAGRHGRWPSRTTPRSPASP